jgi:SAM-dependent methyltransferase
MQKVVIDRGWMRAGYEWADQAKACGKGYEEWKRSIVEWFIRPQLTSSSVYLEIGPGMGRWASSVAGIPRLMWLVEPDSGPQSKLRERSNQGDVRIITNHGDDLPGIPSGSVDFVWSYDVFVHLSPEVADSYLREIHRVLKLDGVATLHYGCNTGPGRRTDLSSLPQQAYRYGLRHLNTVDCWGVDGSYHCRLFGDRISSFSPMVPLGRCVPGA